MNKCQMMGKNLLIGQMQGDIPAGFTKLKYIQTNGKQRIDTGIFYDVNNKYSIEIESAEDNLQQIYTWYGHGWNAGGMLGCYYDGNLYYGDGLAAHKYQISADTFYKRTLLINAGLDTYSVSTIETSEGIAATFPDRAHNNINKDNRINNISYPLFAVFPVSGAYGYYDSTKCKYVYVKVNDVFARQYIPLLRNIDSVAGLYDTVYKQFYTNVGTGEFGYETESGIYAAPI